MAATKQRKTYKSETKVNTMKITRNKAGSYNLTGHMAGELVQYTVEKMASWWTVEKIYGTGPEFGGLYGTLTEATDSIISYSDY